MLVGLIHVGGGLPNVALMRLSAYHKALGDEVLLNPTPMDQPDRIYISSLFTWRRRQVEELAASFRSNADVEIGGSGWSFAARLPPEVDACAMDYELYGIPYGMGYSSRGCIRTCAFCPVPRLEGKIREDRSIESLVNPKSNMVMLLDNNFFASDWQAKVGEIRNRGLVVDWPQGNDIRLITDEIAATLADLQKRRQIGSDMTRRRESDGSISHQFAARRLHFAWDLPANDARVEDVSAGVQLLLNAGFLPGDLRFYVLVGFPGYSLNEEVHRIDVLHSFGIEPYVMVYRDYGEQDRRDPSRMALQHWNNGHAWRNVPWAEYRHSNVSNARAEKDNRQRGVSQGSLLEGTEATEEALAR